MPRVSEAHAEARREQILRAASACFAKHGFHRATMKQIFAAAGLSPGSVYTWFPSKRAIIKEMTKRRLASFQSAVAAGRDDPRKAVALYLATVAQAASDPDIGWMNIHLVADAKRDRFTRDVMRTVTAEGVAVLKQAMRKLSTSGRSDADGRAALLQAAAFGIVIQSLINPDGDVASFELAERLLVD